MLEPNDLGNCDQICWVYDYKIEGKNKGTCCNKKKRFSSSLPVQSRSWSTTGPFVLSTVLEIFPISDSVNLAS